MGVEEVPFSELLCEIVDNRGKTCPTADVGIPLIATNCIRNELLYPTYEKVRFVSQHTYSTWFRGHPKPGDILFVNKATPGRVCLVPDPVDFCIAQDMVAVRANPKKIYPKFLFAALRSPTVQEKIGQMHVGTLIPHFKKGDFDKLLLPVPSRDAQEFIGDIYFELSAKIDLNRRMNETLEAMARAIFNSWFVDFDPVRANAEGRDPGLPKHIADLFPDHFEDSELGEIPKGWHVRSLGEILDVKHGFAFGGEYFRDEPFGDILLTPGNFAIGGGFKEEKLKYYGGSSPEEFVLSDGDLLVTMTDLSKAADTLGYPAIVPPPPRGRRFLHNQRLGKIVILNPAHVNRLFLYGLFCDESYRNEILAGATGTTVRHTSPSRIKAFKTVIPPADVMALFERVTTPGHLRALNNRTESHTLIALRDTLLPKLLSGELPVTDAESVLEAAV